MVRQSAAAEHDGIRAGEAVVANVDWLGRLPAGREINTMSEQLGTKSADGGERANPHPRCAIDQMTATNPGVLFHDQFGPPLWLVSKMPARAAGKPGDPVELPDDSVRTEMEQVDVFAQREVADP